VNDVFVDPELANEAFTYRLKQGGEGSVHIEQVLDFNKDPSYLRDLLVYQLTLEAQRRVAETSLSKREIVRRMGTSPAQLYRLLDQTNYAKTVDQLLRLLNVLDCDVELVVRAKTA
jgi:DNA-binding Xre family transcriptional regulator